MKSTRGVKTLLWGALVLGCSGVNSSARPPGLASQQATLAQPPSHREGQALVPTGPLLNVDDTIPAEQDVAQRLLAPRLAVEKEMHQVVGFSTQALTRRRADGPDGLLGNLVADVMRAQCAEATGLPVDVAFTNQGGLRADLPQGPITRGDVLEVMPFDNALVVMELDGVDLEALLNRTARHGGDPMSGVSMSIEAGKAKNVLIRGEALAPTGTYRVCTNDYIFDGGGKYEAFARAQHVNRTGILIRDAIIIHIMGQAAAGLPVVSSVGGRILGSGAPADGGG